ncbi:Carbohydrate-binding module family 50 protein [Fusarium sp. Ph1]|nr:Carbohydrate-binding module family 50 protein [Fusarium sp. Ph1]
MQDFIIESCESGLVVTGGSGGPNSKGQIVDSLIIADSIIANTQNGIVTSLHAENATSLLVQNVGFFNIKTAISDSAKNRVLFRGGDEVHLDSWGFSKITDAKGISKFVNGERIPAMNRIEELLGTAYDKIRPNLFTRRRPKYYNVPNNKVINVKALRAKGDGKTNDTAVLNSILDRAANISSIIYFPYGVPTAGAILMQWNAQEATKGSMGMWDSRFRVGGAARSNLQTPDCAKSTGSIDPKCKAASMLLHLTSGSTAYLEKVWAWAADHNIDDPKHTQILEVQQSDGLWIYNLCTKGTLEMVSLYNGNATLAKDNINGYLSSILAWLEGAKPSYRGSPDNEALTESICGKSCGKYLVDWFNGVEAWCYGYNISRQLPTARGGRMWAGVNEICVKDNKTGEYCNDIIDKFTEVDRIDEMPCSEVCSECYIKKLAMMQSSLYLAYDEWY